MSIVDSIIARAQRDPHYHLPGYMNRWWLVRPRWWTLGFGARVHQILRSDRDRCLHDHPWPSCSIVLRGGYREELPRRQEQPASLDATQSVLTWRPPGSVIFRLARTRHRLWLPERADCWTIFVIGPKARATASEAASIRGAYLEATGDAPAVERRSWGFHTRSGWVFWRQYLNDWERPDDGELT